MGLPWTQNLFGSLWNAATRPTNFSGAVVEAGKREREKKQPFEQCYTQIVGLLGKLWFGPNWLRPNWTFSMKILWTCRIELLKCSLISIHNVLETLTQLHEHSPHWEASMCRKKQLEGYSHPYIHDISCLYAINVWDANTPLTSDKAPLFLASVCVSAVRIPTYEKLILYLNPCHCKNVVYKDISMSLSMEEKTLRYVLW